MARPVLIDIVGRDNASPAFAKAGASATTLAGRLDALNTRAARVGKTMTHAFTLPIVAIGVASAKMATDFSTAMTKIHTQAGGTAKDVETLSKQVLNLAKYAEQGPVELAKSLYHLKSVGMDNVSAMKALRQASDLASVGGASLEETTNSLAGAWRTGIKGATDFHQAVATVNAIIGAGNMSMDDFNAALGTGILPTAKTFGLTLKDVGSALALFTDEGVPADAAATRLRMSFSLLGAPSAVAEKQLKKIGLTGLTLAEDMRKPNGLIVAIGDLKKHLEDSGLSASRQAQLLSHAFGGGRSSSAILSLINNFDVLVKKQDQVTRSMSKYNDAVKAQRATPAAQFKLLESSLQRAAIIIGNELLPYLVTLAKKIGSAAEWFNHLSSSTRKWVIVSALVLAAVGPMITILTRLYVAGRLVVLTFLKLGGAAVAMGRFAAGLLLMNVGLATYETKAFSAGLATRGFLAKFATGPVLGLAAFAVAVGLGGKALSNWMEKGDAGVYMLNHLSSAAKTFTQTLKASNGAVNENVRTAVGKQLQDAGIADKAHKANISISQLTDAVLGGQPAMRALIATWKASGKPADDTIRAFEAVWATYDSGIRTAGRLAAKQAELNTVNLHAKTGTDALRKGLENTYAEQVPAAARSTARLAGSVGTYHNNVITAVSVTKDLKRLMGEAALKGKDLAAALNNIDGGAVGTAEAFIAFKQAAHGLGSQFDKNNKSIVGNSNAALQNRGALLGAIDAAKQHAAAMQAQGKGAKTVASALSGDIQSLVSQAVAAGASKKQIDNLLASLHLMPKDIATALHVNGAQQAAQAILNVQHAIDQLHDKSITITQYERQVGITPASTHSLSGSGDRKTAARGTIVRGPGTGTSDTAGVFALSNGEAVIPAKAVSANPELINALIKQGRGMASGGIVHSGKDWIYNGTRYASERAALNAQARGAKSDQATLSSNASTAIGNVGSAYSPKFNVADVGIGRIRNQLAHAWDVLNAQIAKGLSKNAATKYKEELRSYTELAQKQLAALRVKIKTADISAIKHALTSSASDLRDAFKQINADAKLAGKNLAPYQANEAKLLDKQNAYLKASARLSSMKDYNNGVKSTLAGAFDPTKYGSVTDLISGLGGASGTNNKYAGQLNKLHKETKGNKTLTAFINQLAASGDTATLSTLAGASKRDLGKVASAVGSYNKSLTAGGDAATVEKYGKTVAQQTEATHELKHEMDKLVTALKHPRPVHVHVHVGKEEVASEVFDSHAAGEFVETLRHVVQSGRKGH